MPPNAPLDDPVPLNAHFSKGGLGKAATASCR
jgi:hypothetical protein